MVDGLSHYKKDLDNKAYEEGWERIFGKKDNPFKKKEKKTKIK